MIAARPPPRKTFLRMRARPVRRGRASASTCDHAGRGYLRVTRSM